MQRIPERRPSPRRRPASLASRLDRPGGRCRRQAGGTSKARPRRHEPAGRPGLRRYRGGVRAHRLPILSLASPGPPGFGRLATQVGMGTGFSMASAAGFSSTLEMASPRCLLGGVVMPPLGGEPVIEKAQSRAAGRRRPVRPDSAKQGAGKSVSLKGKRIAVSSYTVPRFDRDSGHGGCLPGSSFLQDAGCSVTFISCAHARRSPLALCAPPSAAGRARSSSCRRTRSTS